jgi:ATP-dependent DNA helicase RecQ
LDPSQNASASVEDIIRRHWGFNTLRPLQAQAMEAVQGGRDSLVVLPTGGGKSLCYQAPAVLRGDTTVVVSPLISLMKDQVDGLQACGVAAVRLDSSLSSDERYRYEQDVRQGAVRLLFVSPERLASPEFCRFLQRVGVQTFAIDEAHCISHWGHDFRPEYRQLDRLRDNFPTASLHAYTATATEQVRKDIIKQLKLKNPAVLVGNFDRPNLNYRVLPRLDENNQVLQILDRHKGEAGIIYCIRRLDVDDLAEFLQKRGIKALPYHAGMTPELRRTTQDSFAAEKVDVIVATVAFGMGIDRSNVRFVLHTAMPKSLEHYQQETGRAGRDGLEAECVLLHSGADAVTWRRMIEKSAAEAGVDPDFLKSVRKHLDDIDRFCRGAVCRHAALVRYFDQEYPAANCAACDVCLGDAEPVADGQVIAQKILSCVARVRESFGVNHVIGVLRGENTENIRKQGHERLSTYGLLHDHGKAQIRDWIYQLIGQQALLQEGAEYPILKLNEASWEVMKGKRTVRLLQVSREKPVAKAAVEAVSWEGVDRVLFDALVDVRRQIAQAEGIPAFVVFGDITLRELARVRPSSLEGMRLIHGIGEVKLHLFGERFFESLDEHAKIRNLSRDCAAGRPVEPRSRRSRAKPNPRREIALDLLQRGESIDAVAGKMSLSQRTIVNYLCELVTEGKVQSLKPWVPDELYERIAASAKTVGAERLKPIFFALDEKVAYDDIALVIAHMQAGQAARGVSGERRPSGP